MMPTMLEMSKKKSIQEEVAEVIRDVDIPKKQQSLIKEIKESFDLTETIARALLLKHFWNKEQLCNRYFEDDDYPKTLFNFDRFTVTKPIIPFLCPVCYDDKNEVMGMSDCGHYLCKDCYSDYL